MQPLQVTKNSNLTVSWLRSTFPMAADEPNTCNSLSAFFSPINKNVQSLIIDAVRFEK